MLALLEEFKKEHSGIVDTLKKVEEYGILTREGQDKLMSVKPSLIEHLDEEDEKFYPVLWKEAEQNKKLKEVLQIFAKDLENISRVVFRFFDSYDKGVLDDRLSGDFETLFTVIRHRMENEENILYDEYEKIFQ